MSLHELIQHVREMLADTVTPVEWTDQSLTRWFNDAERRFAAETWCFLEADTDMSTLALVPGQVTYNLDARVIAVLSAHDAHGRELRGQFTPSARSAWAGRPAFFKVFPGSKRLAVHPTPEAAEPLHLTVVRHPRAPLAELTDQPEIPEAYQLLLCDWVASQALRGIDADTEDMRRSDWYLEAWKRGLLEAGRAFTQAATPTRRVIVRSKA